MFIGHFPLIRPGAARASLFAALILTSPAIAAAATIFTTQTPTSGNSGNTSSIELGVRFRSDAAGQITGLRFYKLAGNNGTHTGHLWSNTGTLLGSLTFTGETASGWQTASFAAPIAIAAATSYVASYHTANYTVTRLTFAASGVDNPPLHGLQDGVTGPNGVYAYSSAAIFPTETTRSSNYWVDVIFTSTNPAPTTTSLQPSSATAGGAAFTLQIRGTGFVPGSIGRWNGGNRTTTFLSTAALSIPITAADIASAGTALVTVFTSTPGGGLSNASTFTIAAPAVDTSPPNVSISSPIAGSILRATVTVTAAASDNVGVAKVQFKVDGAALGAPDVSAPFSAAWNTALSSAGAHSLTAVAWDAANNASTSTAVSVTVDNAPPLISSIAVSNVGQSSATIAWITNEPANAQVDYGTSAAYGSSSPIDAAAVTAHSRLLNGLAAGTLYHYRVKSTDTAGNFTASGDNTFTTLAQAGSGCLTSTGAWKNFPFPAMTGPFTADFDAVPHAANMDGIFGLSNGAASAFTQLADIVRFNTSNLIDARNGGVYTAASAIPYTPGASYHFYFEVSLASHTYNVYVSSPSAARQLVGGNFSFRTEQSAVSSLNNMGFIAATGSTTVCGLVTAAVSADTAAPTVAISSPLAGSFLRSTVTITAAAADNVGVSKVQFKVDGINLAAPDASPPFSAAWNTALSTAGAHSLTAVAWDAANNASTSAAVSVTVDNTPPLISSVDVTGIGQSSASVAWSTNEPATSRVEYGTSTAYGLSTATGPIAAAHSRSLTGLSPGTVYHYRATSADAAGNLAAFVDEVFTTASTAAAASFTDDFSSYAHDVCFADGAVFGPWTAVFNGFGCTSVISDGPKSWLQESPFASGDPDETHAALVSGVSFFSPLTLSVAARTTSQLRTGSPPNPWEVAWVIWHYTDNTHFYYFVPKPNGWELGKEDPAYPGAQRFLAAGSSPAFPIISTYTVKIVQTLNVITVSVNGVVLTTFTDTERPYTSGRVSLYTEDAVARFTNVAVNISTDGAPPSVALTAPAAGSTVSGATVVTATATDNVAVATVQFRLDGNDLGPPDASAPYATSWNTASSSDGAHSLAAVAWDAAGNASTAAAVAVNVDNTPPLISSVAVADVGLSSAAVSWLTGEPATSQVEYGTSAAYGAATAFNASTVAAHNVELVGLSSGTLYHYRVKSTDTAGNFAASGDETFATNAYVDVSSPSVSVSSPAAGSLLVATVTVAAAAADDVAVATVQFRLDGADLGPPDISPPFATAWDTALSSDGAHSLTAVAWDAAGNASTSAAVVVNVDNTPPLISSVAVADVGLSSAAVSWLTGEPATSQVEYGTSAAYGAATAFNASTAAAHNVALVGLSSGTLYHYRVKSTDTAGNFAASGDETFATNAYVDVSSPSVSVSSPAAGSLLVATVTVAAAASDDVAVATVQFRLDGLDLGPPDISSPFATAWDTALSSDGAHSLTAVAWDAAGNASTSAAVIVNVDNTPPLISSVAVADVGRSSAVITWLTDEPATSQVEYGTSTAYGGFTAFSASTVTVHTRLLSGLAIGTLYHYRVKSTDTAGNFAVSSDETFSTDADSSPPAVSISSPAAGALLAGTVNVAAAAFDDVAVASVQFRLDGIDLGPPDVSTPFLTLWNTALSSDGAHGLAAVAWDSAGNASTSATVAVTVDNTPPLISSVAVADVGLSSAVISWLTDEPATSQVEFGTSTAYGASSAFDASTVTAHGRLLSGLASATLYHYRVKSTDTAGNFAASGDNAFTTSAQPCLASAGIWRNTAIAPQVSSFTVAFDVTPSSTGMDASIGLSSGAAAALTGLAAAVRFSPQGFIDVRYSTAYARMSTLAYSTGVSYHFDMRVNASAHIFDVYVTSPGGPRSLLARSYTFRAGQSTTTVLANVGLFAATGVATMCNLAVAPSTVPWWDGIRELYATSAGSKTWYSTWDNGINRSFGEAVDPTDPWFDAAHGTASYLVDAASGVFKISGSVPRMYIHHPDFIKGSSSSTVAGSHGKQWHDVEMTVYGMRVADNNTVYAGIDGIARTNHGTTADETSALCDTRGTGARYRYDGHLDFEKETRHPDAYQVASTTATPLWPTTTSMPFNVWIGFKYVVYDLPNGNVKYESYMDMTSGAGGGNWILVNQYEDTGIGWGGGTSCKPGIDTQLRLTNSSNRPGSESGIPNASVYFRSDGVGTNGLLYKKMSIREIAPPTGGGPGPLAALGAPIGPSAVRAAAADAEFAFRDVYAFPNPSRRGEIVTIRLQTGVADAVDVNIFDVSGRRVDGRSLESPAILDDGNGKGPQYTYDFHWDVRAFGSAVYTYSLTARKSGKSDIGKIGKVAILK